MICFCLVSRSYKQRWNNGPFFPLHVLWKQRRSQDCPILPPHQRLFLGFIQIDNALISFSLFLSLRLAVTGIAFGDYRHNTTQ